MSQLALAPVPADTVSCGTAPKFSGVVIGLDTIKVSGPLKRKPTQTRFTLLGKPLKCSELRGTWRARWERSLPTWRDGHNLWPMPFAEALDALRLMYDTASQFVTWAVPFEDVTVTRLDAVRHFQVTGFIDSLLLGLQRLPLSRPSARRERALWDSHAGYHALSVASPKRWKGQLYDKRGQLAELARRKTELRGVVESVLPAATGVLRFEAKMLYEALYDKKMSTVGALNEGLVTTACRKYFETECRFGQTVGDVGTLRRGLQDMLTSDDHKYTVHAAGMLLLDLLELQPSNSAPVVAKYRGFLKKWGLNATMIDEGGPLNLRLDWDSGRIVVNERRAAPTVPCSAVGREPGNETRHVRTRGYEMSAQRGALARPSEGLAHALEECR